MYNQRRTLKQLLILELNYLSTHDSQAIRVCLQTLR